MSIQEYKEIIAGSSNSELLHEVLIKLVNYKVNDNSKNSDYTQIVITELNERIKEGSI